MTQTAAPPEDHHEHPEHLAHHFESLQQQFDSGKLGIWLFLTTEILMFSGLFCGYAVMRTLQPKIFLFGHHFLNVNLGALNTMVLIFSSFTMAWGVRAAQLGQTKLLVRLLSITLACAFVFLGVKAVEYTSKFEEHALPGPYYKITEWPPGVTSAEEASGEKPAEKPVARPEPPVAPPPARPAGSAAPVVVGEKSQIAPGAIGPTGLSTAWLDRNRTAPGVVWDGPEPPNVNLFFGLYFAMTGLHAFHVLGGMVVIVWLILKARRGEFGPDRFAAVDFVGLYWHLVDLVWIFLFPLLYLIT
jgi:cytochrome c oxidase subunit 3